MSQLIDILIALHIRRRCNRVECVFFLSRVCVLCVFLDSNVVVVLIDVVLISNNVFALEITCKAMKRCR